MEKEILVKSSGNVWPAVVACVISCISGCIFVYVMATAVGHYVGIDTSSITRVSIIGVLVFTTPFLLKCIIVTARCKINVFDGGVEGIAKNGNILWGSSSNINLEAPYSAISNVALKGMAVVVTIDKTKYWLYINNRREIYRIIADKVARQEA